MIRIWPSFALFMAACASPSERGVFEQACEVLERTPIGTEIREIELRLSLPPPSKTFVGSSLYPRRVFRYLRQDGLFIEIGLFQQGEVEGYPEGRFEYVGDHTVSTRDQIWKRWVWDDLGPIEYRGPRNP